MNKIKFFSLIVLFLAISLSAQTKWKFDNSHTQIKFSVTHLLITEVDGLFKNYEGTVETNGDNFENAKINFKIDVSSIDTDNTQRDEHLKSDDFFAADKFSHITFKGKSLKKINDKNYKLVGDLTMRGITKEIELNVRFNGIVTDPWGNTKAGFKITGSLNRFDYGLKWNALIEAGGAVVGEDVELIINVQLSKA